MLYLWAEAANGKLRVVRSIKVHVCVEWNQFKTPLNAHVENVLVITPSHENDQQ